MTYSNEFKVGLGIVLAAIIFFVGVRYLQDLPLLGGSSEFETAFPDAGGLVVGNAVRINGVNVGSVRSVTLKPGSDKAHVFFNIDKGVIIPEGSTTSVGGMATLGIVRLDINLGPTSNPALRPGAFIPSYSEDNLEAMLNKAPTLINRADSLMLGASAALGSADALMSDPQSDLRQTLVAIQGTADALNQMLGAEQSRLTGILVGVETLTDNLNNVATTQGDSLRVTTHQINQVLRNLDQNLASLEATTSNLNEVIGKINRGQGTLGLLINDPSLHHKLDSTLTNLNALVRDFQQNPKRYLKDLTLVDVF